MVQCDSHWREGEYYIDDNTFMILSSKFEEPDQTESVILYED